MAKGRFISKEICLDKKVNELSDGYSMVGFTWLITHTDCEGRTYGDPAIVKSLIFPRRIAITVEMIAGYIQEWEEVGLIITYQVNGDQYIEFPNFGKHQVGLRKEREQASHIPANCGFNPEASGKNRVNVKLSEVNIKLSEGKNGTQTDNFYSKFSQKIGIPLDGGKNLDYLKTLVEDYGEEKVLEITGWFKKKDPSCNTLWKALRAIDTAAQGWSKNKSAGMSATQVLEQIIQEEAVTNGN